MPRRAERGILERQAGERRQEPILKEPKEQWVVLPYCGGHMLLGDRQKGQTLNLHFSFGLKT